MDTALLTLRASTHQEWAYLPYQAINTFANARFINASRKGERVDLYYTQALVRPLPQSRHRQRARRRDRPA